MAHAMAPAAAESPGQKVLCQLELFLRIGSHLGLKELGRLESTAKFFNVKLADLKGPRRTRQLVTPRQIAMFLIRKHTSLSLPEIGKRFGGRDHTTVIHAVKKVDAELTRDIAYRNKLDLVARTLGLPND